MGYWRIRDGRIRLVPRLRRETLRQVLCQFLRGANGFAGVVWLSARIGDRWSKPVVSRVLASDEFDPRNDGRLPATSVLSARAAAM